MDTLSFVMVACLFANLVFERGGDVLTFVKAKLAATKQL
jgi:hypothetical protein